MSSSNYFGPEELPRDGYGKYSDEMDYLHDENADGSDFPSQALNEKMADDFAAAINNNESTVTEEKSEDRVDSLENYLNQWKQQQSTDRNLCENVEITARDVLGSEYLSILSQGLGKPEAIVQSWLDRPACMPTQLPLVIELLKFCPPENWPMRWQKATARNGE
ncbi:MAG: hypothetical protein ACR2PH_07950 [Desulfobulbia bacterium]